MEPEARIYVAGHTGLVGSALVRCLRRAGHRNLLTASHAELDLTDQSAVEAFFRRHRPEYVFLCAGVAGGIHRNKTCPAEMIRDNLAIQTHVMHAAWQNETAKLLFVASACTYPKHCDQPIGTETFMAGPVEPTNEPFAVAKIAGITMADAYRRQYGARFVTCIPATIYGPGDHFDANGHVVSALIDRFHRAKLARDAEVAVWGTGRPRREFLYADDFGEALAFLMDRYEPAPAASDRGVIHVGSGEDTSIADLAKTIRAVVGYEGLLTFDTSRPDGMPRRLLDSTRIREMGWSPTTDLHEGLRRTYDWYLQNAAPR